MALLAGRVIVEVLEVMDRLRFAAADKELPTRRCESAPSPQEPHLRFRGALPPIAVSSDGADMGKLLVAAGLRVTALPDYSIEETPPLQAGAIVHRSIAGKSMSVSLLCVPHAGQRLRGSSTNAVRYRSHRKPRRRMYHPDPNATTAPGRLPNCSVSVINASVTKHTTP
jgi:hypothetical protein